MNRNLSIDILKYIMALLVVYLHLTPLKFFDPYISYITAHGVARIAVPMFLIISGYYFAGISANEKYKKWMKRLLFLYLIWNTFYYIYYIRPHNIYTFIDIYLNGFFLLWFLINSVYAFLILWMIRKWPTTRLIVVAVVCGSVGLVLQYIFTYNLSPYVNSVYMFRNFLFDCLPFILIGFLIRRENVRFSSPLLITICIIGLLALVAESSINYINKRGYTDLLLSLYIITPALFMLVLRHNIVSQNNVMGNLSTGVYVIHVFVWDMLPKFVHLGTLRFFASVLIISHILVFAMIWISRKIQNPITKYWL